MAKKNIITHSKKKKAKALFDQKKYKEARELYQKVCEIDKRDADAWFMLGMIDGLLGYKEQSIDSLEHAVLLRPKHVLSYYNLGISYRDVGKLEAAIAAFSKSVNLKPDYIDAHQCLAAELINANELDRAVEALHRLIKLAPMDANFRNNLGTVLQAKGVLDEAIENYREALRLKPDMSVAWDSLGSALTGNGQFDEAIDAYRQSLKIAPDNARGHSNLLMTLNYMGNFSSEYVFEEHKAWGDRHANKPIKSIEIEPIENRLIRVGYISPDFRQHSVGYFIEPLLESHNKDKFEITCYSSVPPAHCDATTDRFKLLASCWRDISKQSVNQVVAQIRKDKIDILVDLSGHTSNNHLQVFSEKPAPVQITWLGYPNTTGLQTIDYRIVDNITDPEGSDIYCTEKLIRMPDSFICYKTPESAPEVKSLPYETNGYITFGSFNNLSKIGIEVVRAWSELLLRIPNARLFIKNPALTNETSKAQYRQYFMNSGVDTERIILIGHTKTRDEHLDLYNRIDIALDTFPYNGTTTTCEALWMGVPVIALMGNHHAARVSASLLTNIDLDELIASDIEDYISLAYKLANDADKLKILRLELRSRMISSKLCNSPVFTRQFERVYLKVLNNYLLQ